MLSRSKILDVLGSSLSGDLFKRNFPLLIASISLVSALADCLWPAALLDEKKHLPMLATLLSLLPGWPLPMPRSRPPSLCVGASQCHGEVRCPRMGRDEDL